MTPNPFTAGAHVRIRPEFQDPGDDQFTRIIVEAPQDSNRVLVRTEIPGMVIQPTRWERIEHLEPAHS